MKKNLKKEELKKNSALKRKNVEKDFKDVYIEKDEEEFVDIEEYDDDEAKEFEKELEEEIVKGRNDTDDIFVGSSIEMFMKELSKYPLLSKDQEKQLAKICKCGNENEKKIAKERLLLCNLRLIVYVAKKYRGLGLDFEDLISEGYIGLNKGIERFDYKKGFKLSTFVLYWIRQSISRAIDDQGRTVRLPVHINDKLNKYKKIKNQLINKLGHEPTIQQIAKKMKISVSKLECLINSSLETISLDKSIGDEEDATFGEMIADENVISPEEYAKERFVKDKLSEAMKSLKPRERFVIEKRNGFNDDKILTLEEVGKLLNITRERVRQIEEIAYRKLRYKVKDLHDLVA